MYRGRRPTGNTREALHQQSIYDRVVGPAGGFNQSSTVSVSRTTQGTFLKARRVKKAKSATVTSDYEELTLQSVWHDVLLCKDSENNTVYCLKPYKLRNSVSSEILDNVTFSFVYDLTHVIRTSTRSIPGGQILQEVQRIVPRYRPVNTGIAFLGDKIFAMAITGVPATKQTGEEPVTATYIDLNIDGRVWAHDEGTV